MTIAGMTLAFPSLPQIVFLGLAVIAVAAALLMITRNDAVHSALALVIVLFQLAGMYVLLNAPFLAVLQVLVYAGAILVLFLFVIMLLQLRSGPELGKEHNIQRVTAWPIGLLLGAELVLVIFLASSLQAPPIPAGVNLPNPGGGWPVTRIDTYGGEPRALGIELYTNFLLPFEVASLILLVAVVGAIVLARREDINASEIVTRGLSLGRIAPIGSAQAAEIEKTLAGEVPNVRVLAAARAGDAPAPPVETAGVGQPNVTDRRSSPSSAADVSEDRPQNNGPRA